MANIPENLNFEKALEELPKERSIYLERQKRRAQFRTKTLSFEAELEGDDPKRLEVLERQIIEQKRFNDSLEAEPSEEAFSQTLPNKEFAVITGHVERNGRNADTISLKLLDADQETIVDAPIGKDGKYILRTPCIDFTAGIYIHDGKQIILMDNNPILLAQYTYVERNYNLRACSMGGIEVTQPVMPNLIESKSDEAKEILSAIKMSNVKFIDAFSTKAQGEVIAQQPNAGIILEENQQILLTLSLGRVAVMPNVVGKNRDQAGKLLDGLPYGTLSVDFITSRGEVGTIAKQDPKPRTVLNDQTEILLCIIEKPITDITERVRVPNLVGLTWRSGQAKLKEAGFSNYIGTYSNGKKASLTAKIQKQTPKENSLIKLTDAIRVQVE